jgi:hypothetical protein
LFALSGIEAFLLHLLFSYNFYARKWMRNGKSVTPTKKILALRSIIHARHASTTPPSDEERRKSWGEIHRSFLGTGLRFTRATRSMRRCLGTRQRWKSYAYETYVLAPNVNGLHQRVSRALQQAVAAGSSPAFCGISCAELASFNSTNIDGLPQLLRNRTGR